MSEISESIVYFWLSRALLGAHRCNELLNAFGYAELWNAFTDREIREAVGEKYGFLRDSRDVGYLQAERKALAAAGIQVVTRANPDFPERLRQKEVSPPVALYCKGDVRLLTRDTVTVVGTRACSRYGRDAAERLTAGLIQAGMTVVTGMATGIDGYVLRAAIDAGGRPISVLASGLDKVTPVSHEPLAAEVAEKGLLVSELPLGTDAQKFTFRERNRLLAGLSLGVVVVEAGERSGALITANCALEQGREVFAVPGNISSTKSVGANKLIQDGAKLVLSSDDILAELGVSRKSHTAEEVPLSDGERAVMDILTREGCAHFDELCDRLHCKPFELTPLLVGLELKDRVTRLPANNYAWKDIIR